jgi:hypothetical protein
MAKSEDPMEEAIFDAMEKLLNAGYEYVDVTKFGMRLFDYVDNHPEDRDRIMEIANAYTGRIWGENLFDEGGK